MTRLIWDQIGDRIYETGIDHGVLYIPDDLPPTPTVRVLHYNTGFAWNGLISIDEDFADDATDPLYYDGVKYLDSYNIGDFSAQLSAYTYPDEFLACEGVVPLGRGLFADGQASTLFGLSYRTLVGHDLEETGHGYQIHLLYNLSAVPSSVDYQNGSDSVDPIPFDWEISSVPENAGAHRSTAHVILDSRYLASDILAALEDIIYGRDGAAIIDGGHPPWAGLGNLDGGTAMSPGDGFVDGNDDGSPDEIPPRLPSLSDLIYFVYNWNPKIIIPDSLAGLADLVAGMGDLTPTKIDGLYAALPSTTLVKSVFDGFYVLE
jgi:hypothetical protein